MLLTHRQTTITENITSFAKEVTKVSEITMRIDIAHQSDCIRVFVNA